MHKTIILLGASGNLGGRIAKELVAQGATVKALVRPSTDASKLSALEKLGVVVIKVDIKDKNDIARHCMGAHCMVSALAGLHETIIDTQKIFLDAAIAANVPRFIPSDFSSDFTNLLDGRNRNLDFRRTFHQYLDATPIKATTIFNGPFMDLLTTDMPLILFKQKRILCWGNPDQLMEFTTIDNVAQYTAAVALDQQTPRYLRIAGDVMNCNQFVRLLSQLTNTTYKLFRPGGIGLLNVLIRVTRFFAPGRKELYPPWQGMQYMRDMMEGRIVIHPHDNNKYPHIRWTTVKDFLTQELSKP